MRKGPKAWLRLAVTRVLRRYGAVVVRATPLPQVTALLERLHPQTTDRPLLRLGPQGDGGYLVPDDFEGIAACFSPGVADISGFEADCAHRGIDVFMADASVDGPAERHERFHFVRKNLGAVSEAETMTLADWVNKSLQGRDGDLMMQMDIEGGEYTVLSSTPEDLLRRMRIIVIEFHDLDALFGQPAFAFMSRCFERLLATHACVHIHPNNCCGTVKVADIEVPRLAEFTFIRRDRQRAATYASQFPHLLDCDNTRRPHLRLPSSMYRG